MALAKSVFFHLIHLLFIFYNLFLKISLEKPLLGLSSNQDRGAGGLYCNSGLFHHENLNNHDDIDEQC